MIFSSAVYIDLRGAYIRIMFIYKYTHFHEMRYVKYFKKFQILKCLLTFSETVRCKRHICAYIHPVCFEIHQFHQISLDSSCNILQMFFSKRADIFQSKYSFAGFFFFDVVTQTENFAKELPKTKQKTSVVIK